MFESDRNQDLYGAAVITASADPGSLSVPIRLRPLRKKRDKKRFPALLLALCICASASFGFAGGYLAQQINPQSTADSGTETIYSSIISTTAAGDGSDSGAMTVPEVAAAAKQAVVEIKTETAATSGWRGQSVAEGAGSGVIISSDGYIVTNNHVISGARSITVRLSGGAEYAATLIGTDAKTDIAVIKINASGLTPALLGDSKSMAVGQTTVAVGNPLGELGGTVTVGVVSALDREITIEGETMSLLQTDAAINPGNSGGGLFNLDGELIGIVNAKSSGLDIEGLGFAIPINTAKPVIEDIKAYGYVRGRINTGLTLVDITDARVAMMYRVSQTGLYITASTNSALQSGDRITAVDGKTVTNLAGFNAAMNTHKVGDTVNVTVSRNGQSFTVSITLTELKS